MPGRSDKEHELIQRSQQGDRHAFGNLYEAHAPAIYRYLFTHLENSMDAEDLTGEVFLKAWQSLPKYEERGAPFLAFLFRIARNVLVDHYRQSSRFEPKAPDAMDSFRAESVEESAEMVSRRMDHQHILRVLSQLKRDYQDVLTLRFIGELSPDETAQVMNRSVGAIRVLQHRALAALRAKIDEWDDHEN